MESGDISYRQLRAAATGRFTEASTPSAAVEGRSRAASDSQPALDIFLDVGNLKAVLGHLGEAGKELALLVNVWGENGGRDVEPLLPLARRMAKTLASLATALSAAMPTSTCDQCAGEGCRGCSFAGWLPRSGAHPKAPSPTKTVKAQSVRASRKTLAASRVKRPARKSDAKRTSPSSPRRARAETLRR